MHQPADVRGCSLVEVSPCWSTICQTICSGDGCRPGPPIRQTEHPNPYSAPPPTTQQRPNNPRGDAVPVQI